LADDQDALSLVTLYVAAMVPDFFPCEQSYIHQVAAVFDMKVETRHTQSACHEAYKARRFSLSVQLAT
jgi:hypothetical protein